MTSALPLAIVLLLSSSLLFAQQKQQNTSPLPDKAASTPTASEPWKIVPDVATKTDLAQDPLARLQNSQPPLYADRQSHKKIPLTNPDQLTLPVLPGSGIHFRSPGQRADDDTCLKLRTYVVARDSKDSDSTHYVGYTNCQPSSRYQLRTTVGSDKP